MLGDKHILIILDCMDHGGLVLWWLIVGPNTNATEKLDEVNRRKVRLTLPISRIVKIEGDKETETYSSRRPFYDNGVLST